MSNEVTPKPLGSNSGNRLRWLRYGGVAVIVLGAAAICARAWLTIDFDDQKIFLTTAPTLAGASILLVAWLLLTAPWRWRTKGLVTAAIGALVLVGMAAVRVEGTTGNVVPRFAWRWTPKHDFQLAADLPDLTGQQADLRKTTPNDYAQFLGPDRRGAVAGPALARDWDKTPPRELWRREIGSGWGQFAIVGDYAVTQEQRGDKELVVCYELLTGKPVWSHADETRFDEIVSGAGPRSTPTIDNGLVYTVGATGRMNCLDGATGAVLWSHDILKENDALNADGTMRLNWGLSVSPLVVDDLVVVNPGGKDGKSLVAYNKDTGKQVWSTGDDRTCYSSPHLCTLAGQRQIVVFYQDCVVGHEVDDGHELWRYKWPSINSRCSQPLIVGDEVLVSAGYGDGSVMVGPGKNEGAAEQISTRWKDKNKRNLKSKFANMVLLDGNVYGLDDGVLTCVDAATGARRWKSGRYGHGQLLLVNDLLIVQAENGNLILVEPNPKKLIEHGRIQALLDNEWSAEVTWNNPAISGKYLLVRNAKQAICYELPVE
jgi:outer membrane protein assembly factor BamB